MKCRVLRFVFFAAFATLLFALQLAAQTRVNSTGTGGIHTIQGQIYAPNGRTLDSPATVRLQSIAYTELTVVTDQSGGFAFKRLAPGNYSLVVEAGDNIEPAREYLVIDPEAQGSLRINPVPKTFTIPIFLREKGKEKERAGVIDARLAGLPKDAIIHYERGLAFVQQNNTEEAIVEFNKALKIYPDFVLVCVELGKIYIKKGAPDKAVSHLQNAVRLDSKDFSAVVNCGVALFLTQKYQEANIAFVTAASLNPTAVTPHYYLGILYVQEKRFNEALDELETAKRLKDKGTLPLVHRYLGGIYLTKHNNEKAISELETYLALDPKAKDADRIRRTIADLKTN